MSGSHSKRRLFRREPTSSNREEALVHEALRCLGHDREVLLLAEWEGLSRDAPQRPGKAGSELLVVEWILYAVDPGDGGWIMLGSPESIDPGSGTTPDEYLSAVREDTGGATLRRITDGMTGLTTGQLDDGSTVYSGTVAAGLIARESGFKEGQPIRVLPFGYVAHNEAADPSASLDAAVTVDADGTVREITVTWGSSASAWTYTVTYTNLGTTPALVAPENPRPLEDRSPAGEPRSGQDSK